MIVIEGPDGSGKSTLIQRLSEACDLPVARRACTSTGGPVENLGLWASRDVSSWPSMPLSLYDRHPFISEFVYGPIIRGSIDESLMSLNSTHQLFDRHARIILCLPPLEVVKDNVQSEIDQMPGVVDNTDRIYGAYKAMSPRARMIYDYTQPGSYARVLQLVMNIKKGYTW